MTNCTLREATQADLPCLLKFEQGIVEYERPFDSDLKEGNVSYYDIAHLISSPDSQLVVVEIDNTLVGTGYVQIRPSRDCLIHEKHAYLGFIYLEPLHRGKGIGRLILDSLRQWGEAKGMTHFQLNVYADNESAISAYEKAGFRKVSVLMQLVV